MNKITKILGSVSLCILLAGCWDTGSGEKVGSITRLQKTGVFCKTWEGEIIRGGLNSGSGVVGNAFHFTVESEELAKKVHNAMQSQQEVKISYSSELISWCRSDSRNYFLTGIEPLNTVATPPVQVKSSMETASTNGDTLVQILKQNQDMLKNQQAIIEELRKR